MGPLYRPTVTLSGDVHYSVEPGILYRAAAEAAHNLNQSKIFFEDGMPVYTEQPEQSEAEDVTINEISYLDEKKQVRYVLIIDEINRADLSKVLGEVMYCIEIDYRGSNSNNPSLPHFIDPVRPIKPIFDLKLEPFSDPFDGGKNFYIPENLYIIGTMNHADRSISGFDMALRRRFAWARVDYSETVLREMLVNKLKINVPTNLEKYILRTRELNDKIKAGSVGNPDSYADSIPLTEDHMIGHAYFFDIQRFYLNNPMQNELTPWHLERLWLYFIEPLLEDYLGMEVHDFRPQLKILKTFFTKKL